MLYYMYKLSITLAYNVNLKQLLIIFVKDLYLIFLRVVLKSFYTGLCVCLHVYIDT